MDATHKYMYVFLLAGCEVTLSALVIALGNFLCLGKKHEDPETRMELAVTALEKEGLTHQVEVGEADGGKDDPEGNENGKVNTEKTAEMLKETGKEDAENINTSAP